MMAAVDRVVAGQSVSRETFERLEALEALVRHWTSAINLVSRGSLIAFWQRHIIDSAQIFHFGPTSARSWADLGAGGGFPGLVIAVLAREVRPELYVTLVESDLRKATFLRKAVQDLGLSAHVIADRIEATPDIGADIVSARALAPLPALLAYARKHLAPGGTAIFPKGQRHNDDIRDARADWNFDLETLPSISEAGAAILVIRNLNRVDQG